MRPFIAFITILGMLPSLVRWTVQGNISVHAAAGLAILMVILLSIGSRAIVFTGPIIALAAFGLQYAPKQSLDGLWRPVMALLPLAITLFGIYLMFAGLKRKTLVQRRCRLTRFPH